MNVDKLAEIGHGGPLGARPPRQRTACRPRSDWDVHAAVTPCAKGARDANGATAARGARGVRGAREGREGREGRRELEVRV